MFNWGTVGAALAADAERWRPYEALLRKNTEARARWGGLYQDSHGKRDGEIFLANLSQAQFDALELTTKRLHGPAQSYRGGPYKYFAADLTPQFGVYVLRAELDELGVMYEF